MRKIIVFLTILCIMVSLGSVYALDNTEGAAFFEDAQLLPAKTAQKDGSELLTREEAAYVFANIYGSGKREPLDTLYPDVTADNEYSGYVDFIKDFNIIPVGEEGNFVPEGNVSVEMVVSAFLELMGYEEILVSSASDKYKLSRKIGLTKNVKGKFTDDITIDDLVSIFDNSLAIPVKNFSGYTSDGGVVYKNINDTYMTEYLGISVYDAVLSDINYKDYSAMAKIESNANKHNYKELRSGEKLRLSCSGSIDINMYENVPVIIWVNSKNEIFHLQLQNGVELKYAVIDSINGDTMQSNAYSGKYIKRLTLLDDKKEYKTDKATIIYNLKDTLNPVKLIGKPARVVLRNNKVILIESWDLENGGIIETIGTDTVTYIKGVYNKEKLRNTEDYSRKIVILDGESVSYDRLSAGCVFDFYKGSDTLVIIASEKLVVEKLDSVGDNEVIIGQIAYPTRDTVYYSLDGLNYGTSELPGVMLNKEVYAYFDATGRCAYISLASNESTDTFWAYVVGYDENNMDPDRISLIHIDPEIVKKQYVVSPRVKFNDELTLDDIINSSSDINGSGLFIFTVNSKEQIVSVDKPTPYHGFEDKAYGISTFSDDSVTPIVTVQSENFYFPDAKILGLYYNNGDFSVKTATWAVLRNANATDVKMRFYGNPEDSNVKYAVICGATDNIYAKTGNYGVVYRKSNAMDDNGNKVIRLYIAGKNGGKYDLSPSEAENIQENTLVTYHLYRTFSDNDIKISSSTYLGSSMDDFVSASSMDGGTIRKIDAKRMYLDDGRTFFVHPYSVSVLEFDPAKTNSFTNSSVDAVDPGDRVAFFKNYAGVLTIIYQK